VISKKDKFAMVNNVSDVPSDRMMLVNSTAALSLIRLKITIRLG